jgi:Fe-S cluster assembly iron-binding protein IscA
MRRAACIHEIMAEVDSDYIGVRLGMKNTGCAGFTRQSIRL